MAELEWDDPRLARLIQSVVDRRVARLVAARMPEVRYGSVTAVDAGTKSATVRYVRPGGDDDVPSVAWAGFTPTVGQRVRTLYWPASGERYIDAAVG